MAVYLGLDGHSVVTIDRELSLPQKISGSRLCTKAANDKSIHLKNCKFAQDGL